jgi:hypothetical protein
MLARYNRLFYINTDESNKQAPITHALLEPQTSDAGGVARGLARRYAR